MNDAGWPAVNAVTLVSKSAVPRKLAGAHQAKRSAGCHALRGNEQQSR